MDSEIAQLRLPPHSIEAEQSVLGGLLLNNGTWEDIADIITDDDFYRHDHRMIWQHISNLLRAGRPADALTVKDALQQSGRLEDAGGEQYLAMLSNAVISASNIRHYAEMVRDRAVLRRLIAVSDQIATEAFNAQGRPVNEVLDAAEAEMFKIAEDSGKISSTSVRCRARSSSASMSSTTATIPARSPALPPASWIWTE